MLPSSFGTRRITDLPDRKLKSLERQTCVLSPIFSRLPLSFVEGRDLFLWRECAAVPLLELRFNDFLSKDWGS